MKKLFLIVAISVLGGIVSAQQNSIEWSFWSKKIDKNLYELRMTARLKKGWHIYSGNPGEGPRPTVVKFVKSPILLFQDKIYEVGKLKSEKNEMFNGEIKYYEDSLILVQKITVKGKAKTSVTGNIEYMICNSTQCIPSKSIPFSVKLMD